jgi:lipoyl(octanoyl) transferase
MDLSPFSGINPCGYEGLQTTDMRSQGVVVPMDEVAQYLHAYLSQAIAQRSQVATA